MLMLDPNVLEKYKTLVLGMHFTHGKAIVSRTLLRPSVVSQIFR
jgi:hypothetical protein